MKLKLNYLTIVEAASDDYDMLEIINSDMNALELYVQSVYTMEVTIPVVRARYEGEEVRDRITALDRNRRAAHERAIIAVKRLNRFSGILGVAPLFEGDVNDRYQIADFCHKVVSEIFSNRCGVPNK